MPLRKAQALKAFEKTYRADPPYRDFAEADRARLAKKVPEPFLDLAAKHGWCSFNGQALWLCDPDDWKGVAAPWLPSGSGHVLARTAFGEMIVSGGKKFWLVQPHDPSRIRLSDDPLWVIAMTLADAGYEDLAELPQRVTAARKQAGELDWREIYNYAPAIALGGSRKTSKIVKEDMKVALDILHQLAPIRARDE